MNCDTVFSVSLCQLFHKDPGYLSPQRLSKDWLNLKKRKKENCKENWANGKQNKTKQKKPCFSAEILSETSSREVHERGQAGEGRGFSM